MKLCKDNQCVPVAQLDRAKERKENMTVIFKDSKTQEEIYKEYQARVAPNVGDHIDLLWRSAGEDREFHGAAESRNYEHIHVNVIITITVRQD